MLNFCCFVVTKMKHYSCKGTFIILSLFGVALVLITWHDLQPHGLLLHVQKVTVAERQIDKHRGTTEKPNCRQSMSIPNINQMCGQMNITSKGINEDKSVQFNLHLDLNHNISYCQIQKVGSTFIRRMFSLLDLKSNASKTQEGKLRRLKDRLRKHSLEEMGFRINASMKTIFLRDPYGRAFSGYIDKLFAPNPLYWQHTGLFIMKNIRHSSQTCGHNVTFPEFLKYLSFSQRTMTGRDRHFYPMYDHCSPCEIKYDFVGRMDSFKNDVLCLLEKWNVKFDTDIRFKDFEKENDIRIAHSQITRLFNMRRGIEKCLPFHEAMRRVWKILQIRGIIPISSKFTFTVGDSDKMSKQDWQNVLTNVIENIPNKQSVKSQRSDALAEAYSLVDPLDIQTYTDTFNKDFILFNYDKNPPFLKNISKEKTKMLNQMYFKDLFR